MNGILLLSFSTQETLETQAWTHSMHNFRLLPQCKRSLYRSSSHAWPLKMGLIECPKTLVT